MDLVNECHLNFHQDAGRKKGNAFLEPAGHLTISATCNHCAQAVKTFLIRDQSTLNVRILTRSPLTRQHFDLFRSFGDRLVFGMSLPTLNNELARIYEPHAPAPSQRLATLRAAREAGLHVYVALAPTYPECDEADLRDTLSAIRELDPITVFHEPINIRAENVERIRAHAAVSHI